VVGPHWIRFVLKDCSLWRGSVLEQGKSVGEVEGVAEQSCYILPKTTTLRHLGCGLEESELGKKE